MRKVLLVCLLLSQLTWALDRQPNSDFRMRRQSLASKATGGMVLLFASNEAEGPNDLYGYRPDDNFFYLSGWSEPGAALLIVGAADPKDHSYTEILFLPDHNPSQEKWTGPKLGADSPDAGKITGFDHVEVLDDLRSELVRLLPAKKATVYTDVVADGEISKIAKWKIENSKTDFGDEGITKRRVRSAAEDDRHDGGRNSSPRHKNAGASRRQYLTL